MPQYCITAFGFGCVTMKDSRRADTTQEGAPAHPQIINTHTFY